jgi:hypothetical protein
MKLSNDLLFPIVLILIPFLITQSCWIFQDAKKRGETHYWLWGIFGLLNIPESLIVYLIVTRIILDRIKKNR